jgi:hypothetical protein
MGMYRQSQGLKTGSPPKKQFDRTSGLLTQAFTGEDRSRVLELLLAQEKVVSLIYAKAFPVNTRTGGLSLKPSSGPDREQNGGVFTEEVEHDIVKSIAERTDVLKGISEQTNFVLPPILDANRPSTTGGSILK